jgi:hypothetical protein
LEEAPLSGSKIATRFTCKECGNRFDSSEILNQYRDPPSKKDGHSKGLINNIYLEERQLPKTKAEIVRIDRKEEGQAGCNSGSDRCCQKHARQADKSQQSPMYGRAGSR